MTIFVFTIYRADGSSAVGPFAVEKLPVSVTPSITLVVAIVLILLNIFGVVLQMICAWVFAGAYCLQLGLVSAIDTSANRTAESPDKKAAYSGILTETEPSSNFTS